MNKCLHAGNIGARCNKPILKNPVEYNCPRKQYCPIHAYEDAIENRLDYTAYPKPVNFVKLAKLCGITDNIPITSTDKSWFVKVDDLIKTLTAIKDEHENVTIFTKENSTTPLSMCSIKNGKLVLY